MTENEAFFEREDVVSTYSDREAVQDGILVAINSTDRVSRAVWEFLATHTPMTSQPPRNWSVDMMGWFRAGNIKKVDAVKLIAEHGKDGAQAKFEKTIRDNKALALASGLIAREGKTARKVYDEKIGGGIFSIFAKLKNEKLAELSPVDGTKLWLLPNENGGLTLMFPEDY